MSWQIFANLALSRLFEPPCAACGSILAQPLDGAVCELCWTAIHRITPPVCDRCGDPLPPTIASAMTRHTCRHCREASHAVDRSRAIGPYEGRLRDIIHALNNDGRRSISPRLASMMRGAGMEILGDADCVVPVPLHPTRERARGFNQADDLARRLGLPVAPLLKRTRPTQPQVDLPASARVQNVRNAFEMSRGRVRLGESSSRLPALSRRSLAKADALRPCSGLSRPFDKLRVASSEVERRAESRDAGSRVPSLEGLVIVLVDDVSTTGATLEACARVLKAAGGREVRALTAARVVSGRP